MQGARMNIGFYYGARIYPPGLGGPIHGYQLAKNLVVRGHRLATWYYGDESNPLCTHLRGRHLLRFIREIDALYIRISWNTALARLSCLRLLRPRGLPVVWELNGLPEEIIYQGGTEEDARRITKSLRRLAHLVSAGIGVTDRIQDYLREELGIRRTYCIVNGSDPQMFMPGRKSEAGGEPLRVVWIGNSVYRWHDLDTIVEAARILDARRANVRFLVYGHRVATPDNAPPNVAWRGVVAYGEIGGELASADVGLHLMRPLPDGRIKDALPLKLFDYMASGLAVIVPEYGREGAAVTHWDSGLTTSGTPRDIADKILLLERDRTLCRRLGQNGRMQVVNYYNWARVAAETEAVLLDLTQGGRDRKP